MRHAFVAIVGERILWMLQQRRLFLTYFLFEALIAKSLPLRYTRSSAWLGQSSIFFYFLSPSNWASISAFPSLY